MGNAPFPSQRRRRRNSHAACSRTSSEMAIVVRPRFRLDHECDAGRRDRQRVDVPAPAPRQRMGRRRPSRRSRPSAHVEIVTPRQDDAPPFAVVARRDRGVRRAAQYLKTGLHAISLNDHQHPFSNIWPAAVAGTEPAAVAMDRLLTADELAKRLGMKTEWVWAQARAGRIPHVRLGRYRRFRESAVEAWLQGLETGGSGGSAATQQPRPVALRRRA